MYTAKDVMKYVSDNMDYIMESYHSNDIVKSMLGGRKNTLLEELWQSGCWLKNKLSEHNATEDQVKKICFCHGQRCVYENAFEVAVEYMNEFLENNKIKDEPGLHLAKKLTERFE